MLQILKSKLPNLYNYYQHIQRLRNIRRTKKLSATPPHKYPAKLAIIYEKSIGHRLDWQNLQTYTEKMQWAKLFDKNPLKTTLSDKYAVREWVSNKIGEEYLIPLIGVWESFDQIDFSKLPNQFVLKTNHGSQTVVVVKDKRSMDIKEVKCKFDDWMRINYGFMTGFELHYSSIKPLIIAEQYMESEYGELQDYKFLCFDGKPYFCWVDLGRFGNHTRTVFNMKWEVQPWNQASKKNYDKPIPKPKNYEKMVELTTKLAEGFSHVRVDLYNVNGRIYFGEMTFTNGSGLDPIVPEQYDKMLGDLWSISK